MCLVRRRGHCVYPKDEETQAEQISEAPRRGVALDAEGEPVLLGLLLERHPCPGTNGHVVWPKDSQAAFQWMLADPSVDSCQADIEVVEVVGMFLAQLRNADPRIGLRRCATPRRCASEDCTRSALAPVLSEGSRRPCRPLVPAVCCVVVLSQWHELVSEGGAHETTKEGQQKTSHDTLPETEESSAVRVCAILAHVWEISLVEHELDAVDVGDEPSSLRDEVRELPEQLCAPRVPARSCTEDTRVAPPVLWRERAIARLRLLWPVVLWAREKRTEAP